MSNQHFFSQAITAWYHNNARTLPWRKTTDPYKIWLSEIILQQTRVNQGLPYYLSFLENYPTVKDLANADENDVLRLWQGLGYYSRARNLHFTAKYIAYELDGIFPDNYNDLLKLKGIGKYTAAAIASFAFKEPVAVLDGNVYRVLARVFGIETDISSSQAEKVFSKQANVLIPTDNPDIHNQAIMEFGAMQCTPANPLCLYCPLASMCVAYNTGRQHELPVKTKKVKVRHRFFHYFVIKDSENNLWMRQRTAKDIWQGLYDFMLIETESPVNDLAILLESNGNGAGFGQMKITDSNIEHRHMLTHQVITARFYQLTVGNPTEINALVRLVPDLQKLSLNEVEALPKPVLINNFLNKS